MSVGRAEPEWCRGRAIRILGAAFNSALRSMLDTDVVPLHCRVALLDSSESTRTPRTTMLADLRRILAPTVDDHPQAAVVPVNDVPQGPGRVLRSRHGRGSLGRPGWRRPSGRGSR